MVELVVFMFTKLNVNIFFLYISMIDKLEEDDDENEIWKWWSYGYLHDGPYIMLTLHSIRLNHNFFFNSIQVTTFQWPFALNPHKHLTKLDLTVLPFFLLNLSS